MGDQIVYLPSRDLRARHWESGLPVEGPGRPQFLSPPPWTLARSSAWARLLCSQVVFLLDALLSVVAGPAFSEANDVLLYLGGAILAAVYLGRAATLVTSLEFLLMLNGIHAEHPLVGPEEAWQYPLSCVLFLFTTHQIAYLSERSRRESWKDRQRREVLELLSDFDQLCAEANSEEQVTAHLEATTARLGQGSAFAQSLQNELINHARFTTERIRQTESAHRADVLEATQKLQTAVINSLSHDLQTPLTSILGVFETLKGGAGLSQEQSGRLADLGHEQAERLLRLVRNLLNVAKLEGGALQLHLSPLLLEDVVRVAIRSLTPDDSLRIRLESLGEPVEVQGDAVLLQQIVFNLIDNALKFSSPREPVNLCLTRTQGSVCLEVLDRGCGIRAEDTEHIFERFFRGTTPRKIAGSGLGLHIGKLLAELHQGDVSYSPRPGGGCRFELRLPGVAAPILAQTR